MAQDGAEVKPDELLALLGLPFEAADASLDDAPDRSVEIGRRIRAARQRSGLSATDLAASIGLAPDKLSKIENGRRRVAPRELPRLATALGVSAKFLLHGGSEPGPALSYRLVRNVSEASASEARERASTLLDIEDRLARVTGLPPRRLSPGGAQVQQWVANSIPAMPRTRPEASRQGSALANAVRGALDLGNAEIGDLPGLIEMHFAADVALSPVGQDVAGLCAHTAEQALLLANTTFSTGHVRFTLAHELGHHLLRDPREVIEEVNGDMFSSSYVERRTSTFAAHLLIPAKGVHEALTWLDVDAQDIHNATARGQLALGHLIAKYGTTLTITLNRLAELRIIPASRVKHLKGHLSTDQLLAYVGHLNPTGAAPAQALREIRVPARLLSTALTAARRGQIGMSTIASLLNRKDDDQLDDEIMGPLCDEDEEPLLP